MIDVICTHCKNVSNLDNRFNKLQNSDEREGERILGWKYAFHSMAVGKRNAQVNF